MAATRYLVEGERLDALLAQVRRMGRRVTVLKAEKVRSGGVGGFFAREHYELLVEVEGVGQVPANFHPAAARRPRNVPASAAVDNPAAPAADLALQPPANTAELGAAVAVDSTAAVDAASPEEAGLAALLNEARNHLTSTTEAAAQQVDSALAQMNGGTDDRVDSAPKIEQHSAAAADEKPEGESGQQLSTAQAAAIGFGSGSPAAARQVPAGPVQTGGTIDARLQGVAAPGAPISARSLPEQLPAAPADLGVVAGVDRVLELGVPRDLLPADVLQVDAASVSEFASAIARPVDPLRKPGGVIAVVGPAPQSASIVDVAERLAGRVGAGAYTILGGAKTTLPGDGLRARSAEELQRYLLAKPDGICVLALADSLVDTHRRSVAKLLSVVYVDQAWAVVDARVDEPQLRGWMKNLPDALKPDALAVTHVWESGQPGAVLSLGVPVGMLDGVPARGAAWQMLLEDRI